jgi:hypothetical protein
VKFSCWIFIARARDSKYQSNEMISYPLGSDAIQSLYDARQDGANPDDQHPRQYSQGLSAFVVRKSAIDAVLARLAGRISVHFGREPMR